MKKIFNKYIVSLIILILVSLVLHFKFETNIKKEIGKDFVYSEYELSTIYNSNVSDIYEIQNAYVNYPPDNSLKYKFIKLKERLDIYTEKINYLTLAEKRIKEIETYGYQEFLLNEYAQNINLFIKNEKEIDYTKLKNLIYSHQKRIDKYAFTNNFTKKEKNNTEKVFSNLLKNINSKVANYNPKKLVYNLQDIQDKKDFGSYSIYSTDLENIENLDIVGKKILPPKPLEQIKNKIFQELLQNTNKQDIFEDQIKSGGVVVIPIYKENKNIQINIENPNLFYNGFIPEKDPSTSSGQVAKYYVKVNYLLSSQNKIINFLGEELVPTNTKRSFEKIIEYSEESTPEAIINPIKNKNNNYVNIEVYKYIDPKIILTKNDYLTFTNPTDNTPPKNYFLKTAYVLIFILFFILLKKYLKNLASWIFDVFSKLCKKIKLPIFIFFIISVLIDIFLIKESYDSITLVLSIAWIVVVVGYRLEGRFSFAGALSFLVLCPIFLIFKNEFIAEKAAIWTYMFLVIGTIQSLIELKTKPKNLNDFDEFTKKIKPFFTPIAMSSRTCFGIFQKFIYKIKLLFTKKRTKKEFIIFYSKVIFLLFIIFIFIAILVKILLVINANIQTELKKIKRENLNPKITKIEPTLTYKATKVIIFGKNFGTSKSKLISQYGEITPDYWDNGKIIFTIPTNWKPQIYYLQIIKKDSWEEKIIDVKSEIKQIEVLPISQNFAPKDEEYFKQLPSLSKETLEINGYR